MDAATQEAAGGPLEAEAEALLSRHAGEVQQFRNRLGHVSAGDPMDRERALALLAGELHPDYDADTTTGRDGRVGVALCLQVARCARGEARIAARSVGTVRQDARELRAELRQLRIALGGLASRVNRIDGTSSRRAVTA